MFGPLLRSELIQGPAYRTWSCVTNIVKYFLNKFNPFIQTTMPRSRRRHHSRSRSRSHSHDRDREVKRRRVESPDSSHHRRSVSADKEVTPQKIMSPKEVLKKLDSAKKREEKQKEKEEKQKEKEEKQKEKEEREKKRQEEKQKREEEKLKERKDKEEQKRKEKEEREEQKRKEREEKEEQKRKEREEKEELKRKEKEEKEEQRRKEKEEKDEQKRKEREQKELKRQQEIEEKSRQEKKKEEQIRKSQAVFANFFVPRKSLSTPTEAKKSEEEKIYAFMPFEVKSDMRLAPFSRRNLNNEEKKNLIDQLNTQMETVLYLDDLKSGKETRSSLCTWSVDDDVVIIEESDIGEHVEEQSKIAKLRAKLLKFHENQRPPYFGTWRKKSKRITPRNPYATDTDFFNYEVDSDEDWVEEEPGESLRGSDDEEKDNESDDYEVDNELFVPHGYLSDEEIAAEENAVLTPEIHKAKLELLQHEFEEERKTKTSKLKSRMIGCLWKKKFTSEEDNAVTKFLKARQMIVCGPIVIQKRDLSNNDLKSSGSKSLIPTRKQLSNELIPEFLQLVHGNINNQGLLVNEFLSYLSSKNIDVSISKASLSSQLKQFAKWQKCPEEGAMLNKYCWYVNNDIRNQYNLSLSLPNKWTYTSGDENSGVKKKLSI